MVGRRQAQASAKSVRGRFLPLVRVDANALQWNGPIEVNFSPPGAPPSPPIQIRGERTAQVSATAVQPLSGLYTVYQGYSAASAGEEAARHTEEADRNQVALEIADAYYQALKIASIAEIATTSVGLLEVHTGRARSFFKAGVIDKNQMLEAEVRLAQARAQKSEAEGAVVLARAALAFQMGLPGDRPITPEPIKPQRLDGLPEDSEPDVDSRPDVRAASARVNQASAGAKAAFSRLFPEVSASASYQHVEGQALAAKDQFFAGVTLSWNVWEWGATYYASEEASLAEELAASARTQLVEGAKLEVLKARIDLKTALAKIEAAEAAVEQADENVRIQRSRFEASAATSTDVLDAQALADRTRVTLVSSRYDYLRAVAAFRKAMGVTPVPAAKEKK